MPVFKIIPTYDTPYSKPKLIWAKQSHDQKKKKKMCFIIISFHSQAIFNIGCHHAKSGSIVIFDEKLTFSKSLYALG